MRKMYVFAACALSFVAGSVVQLPIAKAQTSSPASRTYVEIGYHKALPGQNPLKVEREQWTPVHQARVKNGTITSWKVLVPKYAGPHAYDYLTITTFNNLDQVTNEQFAPTFNSVWGKDKVTEIMKQTNAARSWIGSEIYSVAASTDSATR